MTDLMQRLRDADPVTDDSAPPPVEALLARLEDAGPATAGHAARRARRGRPAGRERRAGGAGRLGGTLGAPAVVVGHRRRTLVSAIIALAVAASVVGLQQRSMSPDVVAEAREALGTSGEIIHLLTRLDYTVDGAPPASNVVLDDDQGRPLGHLSDRTERWTALDPLRERSRFTIVPEDGGAPHTTDYIFADGVAELRHSWTDKVQTEKLSQAQYERVRGELSPGQPGADPVAGVRKLLADGDLTAAGEETLDGRRVVRLTGEEPSPNGTAQRPFPPRKIEYLVDATTFAPVRITYDDLVEDGGEKVNALRRVITFEVFERLPMTPENEALLRGP